MTIFKPEGLKIPDCVCFRKQAKGMITQINYLSAIHCFEVIKLHDKMNICDKAADYFISIFIANLATILINRRANDAHDAVASYQDDFEKIYDRLKPMVMQHLDYIDGRNAE